MSGILYGLGVGPGDPELITLKALRIIEAAPVIAYPAPDVGDSLARAIAAPHIPDGKTEIVIRTPMVAGNFPAHDIYDKYAAEIGEHLSAGRDVAVLTGGNPEALVTQVRAKFDWNVAVRDGGVRVEIPGGPEKAAELVAALAGAAETVMIGRPTLEDVFLGLTGEPWRGENEP